MLLSLFFLFLYLHSKLQCLHFSSWDNSKEWMVDMNKGEDIQAVCLGQRWVACATNALLVRIFTVGGVQKEIFSLLGPVVCMAGHGEQLIIVYHRGWSHYLWRNKMYHCVSIFYYSVYCENNMPFL